MIYFSNQERHTWVKLWELWDIATQERCSVSDSSQLGNSLTLPTSQLFKEKDNNFCRFLLVTFSHPLSPSTCQTVADLCPVIQSQIGQSNCVITWQSLRALDAHHPSLRSTYVGQWISAVGLPWQSSNKPVVMGTITDQFLKPTITPFEQKCTISKAINCPGSRFRHSGLNADMHTHTVSLPKSPSD